MRKKTTIISPLFRDILYNCLDNPCFLSVQLQKDLKNLSLRWTLKHTSLFSMNRNLEIYCTAFDWGRVKFLPSSWYSSVLWI